MAEEDLAAHHADWVDTDQPGLSRPGCARDPAEWTGDRSIDDARAFSAISISRDTPLDSADSLHLQIEAMKLAFADALSLRGRSSVDEGAGCEPLDPEYLRQSRAHWSIANARRDFGPGVPPQSGTIYLTAADAGGMMVSYIQSNYMGFGSGVVVPDTGISMQNRGAGFTLRPDHPNQVGPGKRPFHTIIPAFATEDGKSLMSFGVMGADMQPQGHVQMIVRLIDYKQNPQTAADAPRWKIMRDGEIALEHACSR